MHTSVPTTLALFQQIGWMEMVIILGIGVLLFGRRLPEVGKNIGKGIVEFKKGIKGIQDEIEDQSRDPQDEREHSPRMPQSYAAKPPLGPGGEDPRVSQGNHGDPVGQPAERTAERAPEPASVSGEDDRKPGS